MTETTPGLRTGTKTGRARAEELLRVLVRPEEGVDRFDASYLEDLPHLLREVHGLTPGGGGTKEARAALDELLSVAGLLKEAPWTQLPPALRKLGVEDADFSPKKGDMKTKKRFKYVKVASWKEGQDVTVKSTPDAVKKITKIQAEYSLQQGGNKEIEFDALARPLTGDPWTPLFRRLIEEGTLRADEPVLTIGPRWAGEIRYFRQVVGFRNAIGLDLFSKEPDLVKVGDMHAMPFPDNHFGLVYQRNTFDKSYDIRKAIGECVRVLRPGGVLVSDDCMGYTHGVEELARTNMRSNRWMIRFLGDRVAKVLYDRETPSGEEWFERIGQVAVQIKK